jgi:predicted alpha/beta superfamily hydrolase
MLEDEPALYFPVKVAHPPIMHFSLRDLVVIAVLSCFGRRAMAQDLAPPIPERLVLHSTVLAEDRVVFVRLPRSYPRDGASHPVLYLTDGHDYINEIGSIIDFLAQNGRMPELIVVGITSSDRYRDFTSTRADVTKPDGTVVFRAPTSGGADKFLKFIDSELVPEIEKRYRAEPFRILVGHSLGGLFVLHALFSKPSLFRAYIASSPSLEWDTEVILQEAAQFSASSKPLRATLFLSISDEGEVVKRFGDDFEQLRNILTRNVPAGFEWDSLIMKDENHNSGVLRAHYAGLRKIFADWQAPKSTTTSPK